MFIMPNLYYYVNASLFHVFRTFLTLFRHLDRTVFGIHNHPYPGMAFVMEPNQVSLIVQLHTCLNSEDLHLLYQCAGINSTVASPIPYIY